MLRIFCIFLAQDSDWLLLPTQDVSDVERQDDWSVAAARSARKRHRHGCQPPTFHDNYTLLENYGDLE